MLKILKKMNLLLDRKQKRTMVGLIIMMLFGGVLESLGISMLVPIVTVVMDPVAVEESEILSAVYDMLGMESSVEFAMFLLLSFVGMTVLKNIYLFYQQKAQLKFVYTNQFATSRRMMINFMLRPYEYYLNADTRQFAVMDEKNLFYYDDDHLSHEGAMLHMEAYEPVFARIAKQKAENEKQGG